MSLKKYFVCSAFVVLYAVPAIAVSTSFLAHESSQESEASQQIGMGRTVAVVSEHAKVEAEKLDTIIVLGERRSEASSILRSGLDPSDAPWSIQIISQPFLEQTKPEAIEDVLVQVSNVAFQGDSDGRENAFVLRGFQATSVLRDGFKVETFGGVADPEIYNLQSIQVIKGPHSVLFGESNPGGLINMQAKRPLDQDHGEILLDYGTDRLISPKVDFGGPIGNGDIARYRLIGLYKQDDGWREFENPNERFFLAPSAHMVLSNKTAVTLIGEFTDDDYQADFGTAIDLEGELIAPIEQVNNHPQDQIERHQYTVGADIIHQFSDDWHLTARGRYFDGGYEFSSLWLPISLDLNSNTYIQLALQQEQKNEETALQLNVTGDTRVLGLPSDVVAGVDFRQSKINRVTRFDATSLNFLNWSDPDYSRPPPDVTSAPIATALLSAEDIRRIGIFAKTHTELTDAFSLNLGARFDDIERDPLGASATSVQDLSEVTPQLGLMYDLSGKISLFASYSESFSPNFQLDKNNNLLDPEVGKGIDLGLKASSVWNFINFTASFFDITKKNVALPDPTVTPADLNPLGFIAAAKQSSRGVEIDFEADVTSNWKLYGAIGYADTDDMGERIISAPSQTASLRTSYKFDQGRLRGLIVGGDIQYVGDRLALADPNADGDRRDRVLVDSYAVLDMFARYDIDDQWQLQVNLSNITDEQYVLAALNNLSRNVHAGSPFEALFSLSYRFD